MDHDLRKIYVNISEGYLYLRASVVKDAVISEHLSFRHFLYNSAKSLISCDFISVAVFSPTCHAHCFFLMFSEPRLCSDLPVTVIISLLCLILQKPQTTRPVPNQSDACILTLVEEYFISNLF